MGLGTSGPGLKGRALVGCMAAPLGVQCPPAYSTVAKRIIFKKKICPKRIFPSDFVKIGLRNTLFIFGKKNGRLFCFICFVAIFCPILAY